MPRLSQYLGAIDFVFEVNLNQLNVIYLQRLESLSPPFFWDEVVDPKFVYNVPNV